MAPRLPTSTLFPYTTLFRSFKGAIGETLDLPHDKVDGVFYRLFYSLCTENMNKQSEDELRKAIVAVTQSTPESILVKDRKSTRLNSSHPSISYAVFCLKKKT